ncbi:hypothetical protein ACJDU8_21960 [Clostridium sp. WILCCON 0269]|uniref:Uncharacterized protein n=1 Tax=Candidatus Clostridium eludens TaxID=3381663 RepID=A0ABW8SQ69_9CLOT
MQNILLDDNASDKIWNTDFIKKIKTTADRLDVNNIGLKMAKDSNLKSLKVTHLIDL